MKIRTIFCAGMLLSISHAWTVSSSIAWNNLFRETEDLVSEGENIRQADRNIQKLRKDAHRVGGPVYVKRVNRLSRSLEIQKNLAQGDIAQAQRIVRMTGNDVLPSVRMAVQQAQKQQSNARRRSQEKPVVYEKPIYEKPIISQEQETEHKYEEKQREPEPQRISLPRVQTLPSPEQSHHRELMRAQRREKINQLVHEICAEDVPAIEGLSWETPVGEEEPTAQDIESLTDDAQRDIAEFHTAIQATREELPELDNFARDAESKAQACEVRIKAGLSKISVPQPQKEPVVTAPEKVKKQKKRVTFAPKSELEKVKIIEEPEEAEEMEEVTIPSETEGSEVEELSLFEGLTLAPQSTSELAE